MKELITKSKTIHINNNNQSIKIDNIKELLIELFEGSYFSPSYVTVRDSDVKRIRQNGIWIELIFGDSIEYKGYNFSSLLFQVKPKYNFVTLMRGQDDIFEGKCINVNLANNTTELYKILNLKDEK